MDLSRLKWPIIIIVVLGVGWLGSSAGVSYMVNKFTAAAPGQDAAQDKVDEAGLSRVGGYLLMTFRYAQAATVYQLAIDRYGTNGVNYWNNQYSLARCLEHMNRFQDSYNILQMLISNSAHNYDPRVPVDDNLRLRAAKLKEVHELR